MPHLNPKLVAALCVLALFAVHARAQIAVGAGSQLTAASHAEETDHYAVVAEYIRELGANEDLHALAEKELGKSKDNNEKMTTAIRNSTRAKLELGTNINALQKMQLSKPFDTLLPTISGLYQQKIALHDEVVKIAGAFVGGPQEGVDYGAYRCANA